MSSVWFFRAYGPVIVEFVGVVLVAVGARGFALRDGSKNGNIRSQCDGRFSANALAAVGWSRGTVRLGDQITATGTRRTAAPISCKPPKLPPTAGASSPVPR
jgi:hypothetical protein